MISRQWLTFAQLIHIYSVGQMTPGPNMMMIVVIGQWAGGFLGAIVTAIAFFGPTAVLAFVVAKGWRKLEKWPWRRSIQQGLAPVSIGLLLAGCFTMAKGAITGLETGALADPASVQNQPGIARRGWGDHRNIVLHAEIASVECAEVRHQPNHGAGNEFKPENPRALVLTRNRDPKKPITGMSCGKKVRFLNASGNKKTH